MKKCSHCGAENNNENRFCQNCGTKFPQTTNQSNKNLIERFDNANIIVKIITILIVFFIIAFILSATYQVFLGTHYTEDEPVDQIELFNELDSDNDGAISLYEIETFADDVPSDRLSTFFDGCDKNKDGVLKGDEFDNMIICIKGYYTKLDVLKKMEDKKSDNEESSSSSSSSSKKSSPKYVEGCPECGYDEIIVYPGPNGYTVYQCSVCDYESYYESDFIIEERFAKNIFSTMKNRLALI